MTDENTEVLLGYNKFVNLRIKMAVANKKYRDTQHGKEKTRIIRNKWIENHKDDDEYRKRLNLQAKMRYHRNKAKKLIDISLGDLSISGDEVGRNALVENIQQIEQN